MQTCGQTVRTQTQRGKEPFAKLCTHPYMRKYTWVRTSMRMSIYLGLRVKSASRASTLLHVFACMVGLSVCVCGNPVPKDFEL